MTGIFDIIMVLVVDGRGEGGREGEGRPGEPATSQSGEGCVSLPANQSQSCRRWRKQTPTTPTLKHSSFHHYTHFLIRSLPKYVTGQFPARLHSKVMVV